MTATYALACAEAAGVKLTLRPNGTVHLKAPSPPPPGVVAALRHWREGVVELLTVHQEALVAATGSAADLAVTARIKFLEKAAAECADALAAPDADLDAERAAVAAAHILEEAAEFGTPQKFAAHARLLNGLLTTAHVQASLSPVPISISKSGHPNSRPGTDARYLSSDPGTSR